MNLLNSFSVVVNQDYIDLNYCFILDVDVVVLRDYGTVVGATNNYSWTRRELHVAQEGVHIRLTLWNETVNWFINLYLNSFDLFLGKDR